MKSFAMLPRTLALTLFASLILAAEPDRLTGLRNSYRSAITKATAPIQKTYVTELEKLKIEFTKAGNLEAALAVDAELKVVSTSETAIQPSNSPTTSAQTERRLKDFKTSDELASWLTNTLWKESGGTELRFVDGTHFVVKEVKLPRPSSPYAYTSTKLGLLKFQWSNGSESTVEIKSNLRELIYNGKKFEIHQNEGEPGVAGNGSK